MNIMEQEIDLHDQIIIVRTTAKVHGMQIIDWIHSNDLHSAVESASIRIEDLQNKYDKAVTELKDISNHIEQVANAMNKRLAQLIINKYINQWSDMALRKWAQLSQKGLSKNMQSAVQQIEIK